jgi:hypothetical protein
MMTPAEQASERAIIEAATPGPWQSVHKTDYTANGYGDCGHSDLIGPATGTYRGMIRIGVATFTNADCDFIAAARTGWPKALDERDAAIARLAECERERDQARRDCDDLHNELGRLHGHVFSKRDYHAMLARIENTQERAVKAEAEVRELREEITRLRAALESKKESMDARNLHDPAR